MADSQQGDESAEISSQDCDWYLQDLIRLANKGLEVPVTLSCGGLLISGTLIGGKAFFTEQSALMSEAFSGFNEAAKVMTEYIAGFGEIYDRDGEEPEEAPELPSAQFVHLRNAKLYQPGQPPIPSSGPGVLWRGKVASVDGFNWGVLGP